MRLLAGSIGVVLLLLAVGAPARSPVATVALLAAAVITVTTNGPAFTAVAEYAGAGWAGRALGFQNTGQNLFAAATPPLLGPVVAGSGYRTAFAAAVAFPLVAALLAPVRSEAGARETGDEDAGGLSRAGSPGCSRP